MFPDRRTDAAPIPAHRTIRPPVLYFGTPVALITTRNPDGTPNISPMSSAWALGDRIVLGMTATSQGRENAERTRECVINLPSAELWQPVERLARTTGRNPVPEAKRAIGYYHEPDKIAACGLTALAADRVAPPRLAECPLQIEARIVAVHAPATAPDEAAPPAFSILEAQALRVHAHADVTLPGTEHVDTGRWQPLLYVFRHYFGTGPRLGRTFKADT